MGWRDNIFYIIAIMNQYIRQVQHKKGFINIILIISIIIITTTAGYFIMQKIKTPEGKPIINISIEPVEITKGESAVLTWSVENAESCKAFSPTAPDLPFKMDWEGNVGFSGSKTYNNIPHSLEFELSCTNKTGVSVFDSVVLMVKTNTKVNQKTPTQNLGVQKTVIPPLINKTEKSNNTTLAPIIESISPTFGPVGTEVVIKGRNLTGSISILWFESDDNGAFEPRNITIIDSETIKAKIPSEICVYPWVEERGASQVICKEILPGSYKISYSNGVKWSDWPGKIQFTIIPTL